jgi:hypothetical protein
MSRETTDRDLKKLVSSIRQERLDERAFAIRKAITSKTRRRRNQKRMTVAVAFVSLLTVGAVFMHRTATKAPPDVAAGSDRASDAMSSERQRPKVKALVPGTRFAAEETPAHHAYHLEAGILRFETGKNDEKPLIVRVGELVIEDIGTVFTVETLPEDRARISVSAGRVRVTWPDGVDTLDADETGTFPPLTDETITRSKPKSNQKQRGISRSEDWRILARRGRYQQAFEILSVRPEKVENRVDDLLLAADVMRLSGRPGRAVEYLETVTRNHKGDPRSSLAAFTLGRVFLDELGRPIEAAWAFKAARKARGPLAERALAREVEAWSRAGETERAKRAAKQYLRQYPTGDRENVVRAFGGVDEP